MMVTVHVRPDVRSAGIGPGTGRSRLGFGRFCVPLAPTLAAEPASPVPTRSGGWGRDRRHLLRSQSAPEERKIAQIRAMSALFRAPTPAARASGRPWAATVIGILQRSAWATPRDDTQLVWLAHVSDGRGLLAPSRSREPCSCDSRAWMANKARAGGAVSHVGGMAQPTSDAQSRSRPWVGARPARTAGAPARPRKCESSRTWRTASARTRHRANDKCRGELIGDAVQHMPCRQ